MRNGASIATGNSDRAQHSVEFLCNRFSSLFAQLHQEESKLKVSASQNELLERRLAELWRRENEHSTFGRAEVTGRLSEVAEIRRVLDVEERRAAIGGDEAGALQVATAAYARQVERLQDRCREEKLCEQSAHATALRHSEELSELRLRRHELGVELESVEAGHSRVTEEIRAVNMGSSQAMKDIGVLEEHLHAERHRCMNAECTERLQREELNELGQKLGHTTAQYDDVGCHLNGRRSESRECEERLMQQVERRARGHDDLGKLHLQLRERRSEGSECQAKLAWQVREVQALREHLRSERHLQHKEQTASDAFNMRLESLHAELPATERTLHGAEAEFVQLRQQNAELEERCAAHRTWRDELRHKKSSGDAAVEKLRDELRVLASKRVRVQHEVEEAAMERRRLEVEVECSAPALQDVWRRCRELEERLGSRVQELGLEVEKVRRYRMEAGTTQARIGVLERHTVALNARLREYASSSATDRSGGSHGFVGSSMGPEQHGHIFRGSGGSSEEFPPSREHRDPWGAGSGSRSDSAGFSSGRHEATAPVRRCTPDRRVCFAPESRLADKFPGILLQPQPTAAPSNGHASTPSPRRGHISNGRAPADHHTGALFAGHAASSSYAPPNSWRDILGGNAGGAVNGGFGALVDSDDAVRFLCEFVAREEKRVGLTP